MLPGHVIASGTADGVANRRPRRLFGRCSERKNPLNVQFERQVARLESRQQQQRCLIFTVIPYHVFLGFNPSPHANGNSLSEPAEDILDQSSAPIIFLHVNVPDESHKRWADNSSRLLAEKSTASNSIPNSDFLVNSITKTSVNAGHTARRKSKKKSKKHKQRCRKPTDASEIKFRESNSPTPAIDMVDCEESTLSPKHVGDILFEDTFSPNSSVKETSEEAPDSENDDDCHGCSVASGSSVSCCDETEPSRSTTCLELFGQRNSVFVDLSQENCCAGRSGDSWGDNKALLFKNEYEADPCETPTFCCSSDVIIDNWLEKPNHSTGICSQNGISPFNEAQTVHLCHDTSSDSDFHLVISRKRAKQEKKMSLWKSYNGERAFSATHDRNDKYAGNSSRQIIKELNTKNCSHRQNLVGTIQYQHGVGLKHSTKNLIHKPSNISVEPQSGVVSKNSKPGRNLHCFTSPKEDSSVKSNGDFNKEQNIDSNNKVSNAAHSRKLLFCEIGSNSASEPILKSAKGNFTSESVRSTDCTVGASPVLKSGLEDSREVNDAIATNSGRLLPDSTFARTDFAVGCDAMPSIERTRSFQKLCSYEMHLIEMTRVVNDAYEVQRATDAHLAAGHPITDLENFIYSASPVIGHVPRMKNRNYSRDQLVNNSTCLQNISNVSLSSIWEWYEEPGCYGLEVRACNDLSSETSHYNSSEFCAYFVPYLSAVQLFGWPRKNMNHSFSVGEGNSLEASNAASSLCYHPVTARLHQPFEHANMFSSRSSSVEDHGEVIFEYFETEQPSLRPPLFEKIKELVSGVNISGHQILGDPVKLQNLKLCDLHPASWFCVAWYPVYRVPHGNFRAAFLTYHSLGKLVPQKCSADLTGRTTRIVSPVVGLQSYNDKGEQWFQVRRPDSSRAEVQKERLRTLRRGALAMARAVIPKGAGETVNHHPDYEFFLSRS